MKNLSVVLVLMISIIGFSIGQTQYTIDSGEDFYNVSIKGLSTLHDWEAVASEVEVTANVQIKENSISNFIFSVGVESMDGGRGASMNSKIKKALKHTEYPMIKFVQLGSATIEKDSEGSDMLNAKGNVEIAGQTKEINVQVGLEITEEGLIISGSKPLKMSDFGIEPPTAMFGQIKTQDDIVVHLNLDILRNNYNCVQNESNPCFPFRLSFSIASM